jgi:hypothetical protein
MMILKIFLSIVGGCMNLIEMCDDITAIEEEALLEAVDRRVEEAIDRESGII